MSQPDHRQPRRPNRRPPSSLRSSGGDIANRGGGDVAKPPDGVDEKPQRRRRTVLREEYDEFSLERMSVDGRASRSAEDVDGRGGGRGEREAPREEWGMRDLEMTSLRSEVHQQPPPKPSLANNSVSNSSTNEPLEPWRIDEDFDCEERFEFEAADRFSNHRPPDDEGSARISFRRCAHRPFRCCPRFDRDRRCDPAEFRRGASVLFVIAVAVSSAALIGSAVPDSSDIRIKKSDILPHATNSHAAGGIANIRSNNKNQQGAINGHAPQQLLLELAENVTASCDPETIRRSDKRKECQMLCIDKMCCFDAGKYGCGADDDKMCFVYAGCEVLHGSEWTTSIQSSDGANGVENDESTFSATVDKAESSSMGNSLQLTDEIIEYCSEYLDDPKSSGGRECIEYCKGHMCCFDGDGKGGSCKQEEESKGYFSCEVYEGCEVVVGVKELGGM